MIKSDSNKELAGSTLGISSKLLIAKVLIDKRIVRIVRKVNIIESFLFVMYLVNIHKFLSLFILFFMMVNYYKFRKFFVFLLIVSLMFLFVACGDSKEDYDIEYLTSSEKATVRESIELAEEMVYIAKLIAVDADSTLLFDYNGREGTSHFADMLDESIEVLWEFYEDDKIYIYTVTNEDSTETDSSCHAGGIGIGEIGIRDTTFDEGIEKIADCLPHEAIHILNQESHPSSVQECKEGIVEGDCTYEEYVYLTQRYKDPAYLASIFFDLQVAYLDGALEVLFESHCQDAFFSRQDELRTYQTEIYDSFYAGDYEEWEYEAAKAHYSDTLLPQVVAEVNEAAEVDCSFFASTLINYGHEYFDITEEELGVQFENLGFCDSGRNACLDYLEEVFDSDVRFNPTWPSYETSSTSDDGRSEEGLEE